MQTAFGWAAETVKKSCSFPKSCASTEIQRMFKTAANFEHLTANNNTHLQLAGSNNFRSYIVLRPTAVQSVQQARTSAIFCAGIVSVSKSKCQKKTKFSEAWRTKSCKPENIDRRNANETIRLLKIKRNFDEIRVTSSAKEAPMQFAKSSRQKHAR